MNKTRRSRLEMKEALRNPATPPREREELIIMYRAAFMRDLRGMLSAWGDIRKEPAGRLLEDCGNNIKLTITELIDRMIKDGNQTLSDS